MKKKFEFWFGFHSQFLGFFGYETQTHTFLGVNVRCRTFLFNGLNNSHLSRVKCTVIPQS